MLAAQWAAVFNEEYGYGERILIETLVNRGKQGVRCSFSKELKIIRHGPPPPTISSFKNFPYDVLHPSGRAGHAWRMLFKDRKEDERFGKSSSQKFRIFRPYPFRRRKPSFIRIHIKARIRRREYVKDYCRKPIEICHSEVACKQNPSISRGSNFPSAASFTDRTIR